MKTTVAPTEFHDDENFIVDFHELISLLLGKDFSSRLAFRNDVLKRAAKIRSKRRNRTVSSCGKSNIIQFPISYPCSA
jgi:hypothetical protein